MRKKLFEGKQDYLAMINPVLAAIISSTDPLAVNVGDKQKEIIQKAWNNLVTDAMLKLRKQDLIVWFLRMARMSFMNTYGKFLDPVKIAKIEQDYNFKSETKFSEDNFPDPYEAIRTIEHFRSLPIHSIKSYLFRYQSYDSVINDFECMENAWKQQVKSSVPDDPSNKVVIDFHNGWYWINLNKASCDKEAEAMGHCGNSPRSHSTDTILSLRKKIDMGEGNSPRWEPHLTFILDGDGELTEMKGKENNKPVEKYHSMIVALLRNPIVKGITGGGYLPENNFSLDDLSDGERKALLEEKPELGSMLDLYDLEGLTKRVIDKVYNALQSASHGNFEIYDVDEENNTFILEKFDSKQEAIKFIFRDNSLQYLVAEIADNEFYNVDWLDGISIEKALEYLKDNSEDDLYDDYAEQIARKLGVDSDKAFDGLLHIFPNSTQSILDDVRKFAVTLAKNLTNEVLDNLNFEFYASYYDDLAIKCDAGRFIESLTAVMQNGYNEYLDDNGLQNLFVHGSTWGDLRDDSFDDIPEIDEEVNNFNTTIETKFFSSLLDLLNVDDQLSFDFSDH